MQLSVLVHPDKNPGEEARQAFEALNEAHRALKDASKLVSQLKRQTAEVLTADCLLPLNCFPLCP